MRENGAGNPDTRRMTDTETETEADPLPAAPLASATVQVPEPPDGWLPIRHAILADGSLAMAATEDGGDAGILVLGPGGWTVGPRLALQTSYPVFDRFPDGRWLVASVRTDGSAQGRILSPDGAELGRITLGDGIGHLGIDTRDRIWVGWFDEGVFGNDDWRLPGLHLPPSHQGIGCFAADGSWLPLEDWSSTAGSIDDCYALNVTGAAAWTCYYSDFPLVRLAPGEPTRWWRTRLPGVSAIAIDDAGNALFAGGHGEDGARLVLADLAPAGAGDYIRTIDAWTLPLRPLPPTDDAYGPRWPAPPSSPAAATPSIWSMTASGIAGGWGICWAEGNTPLPRHPGRSAAQSRGQPVGDPVKARTNKQKVRKIIILRGMSRH